MVMSSVDIMKSDIHYKHWTGEDQLALEIAQTHSLSEITEIALRVINRFAGDVEMVSGPISTGGVGSVQGNLAVFGRAIEILTEEKRRRIFSQMPFERTMGEFAKYWLPKEPNATYCWPILLEFYGAVFASGRVTKMNFIYGWQSSFGASWEYTRCQDHGIEIEYLPESLSQRIMEELDLRNFDSVH
jgi:hypothetical protein